MPGLERFNEQEIPYEDLAKFGLTQEMIDDLPRSVMTRLLSGYETPVLPLRSKTEDGEDVDALARLQLIRNSDGTVSVAYCARWESNDLERYTPEQRELLKEGKVTTAEIPGKGQCFIQFDDAIQQVMAIPASIIRHNVNVMTTGIGLSRADYTKLLNGEIIQIDGKKDTFSLGIDLNDDKGIRISNGNRTAWREEAQAERLPKYNFGLYGCWMSDGLGDLTYVSEDDYTEEMEAEQQRQGHQNAAAAQMSHMGARR